MKPAYGLSGIGSPSRCTGLLEFTELFEAGISSPFRQIPNPSLKPSSPRVTAFINPTIMQRALEKTYTGSLSLRQASSSPTDFGQRARRTPYAGAPNVLLIMTNDADSRLPRRYVG